jgi:transposase-like protein
MPVLAPELPPMSELVRLKELERENKDLRRADTILKDASIFFASGPGGQTRK